jgi:hypothetical protein
VGAGKGGVEWKRCLSRYVFVLLGHADRDASMANMGLLLGCVKEKEH